MKVKMLFVILLYFLSCFTDKSIGFELESAVVARQQFISLSVKDLQEGETAWIGKSAIEINPDNTMWVYLESKAEIFYSNETESSKDFSLLVTKKNQKFEVMIPIKNYEANKTYFMWQRNKYTSKEGYSPVSKFVIER